MKYRATSQEYVRTFGRLGRAVIARGGFVSFELPRHCEGWKEQTVQAMLEDLKLDPVDVDSSALGLQSKTSEPILKPWRIAVSSPLTRKALDGLRCQGGHTHVPCSGDETARSAFCPEHLCNAIHDGLDAHESASADKDVGGSALRLLGETLLIPMLSARFIPLLSAHNIPSKMRSVSGIVFSMKRREALLLPSVRLLMPRKTLRGSSAASSIICTSRRRMTRSQS